MFRKLRMVLIIASGIGAANQSQAGVFELGTGFSWQRSNFSNNSFTELKRYTVSLGYYFTEDSEISFSYQDTTTKTFVPSVQDTTFRDQVYSLDLTYLFMDQGDAFRPYVKGGIGQLNRDATGTYSGGFTPPGRTDQITAIVGAGIRARLSSKLGLKVEATSYMVGGSISSWKDNLAISLGGSYFF
jgi:hypothetical protein